MITNKFQKLYRKIILEASGTADLTNEIMPLIEKLASNNNKEILNTIKEKDQKLAKYISRFIKFKGKAQIRTQLADYLTNDCECAEEIKELLNNTKTSSKEDNQKKSNDKVEISDDQVKEILAKINQDEECLKLADEAFGEDYISEVISKYNDDQDKTCKDFKEMLLTDDPDNKKAVKEFIKKFNKQTEGTFAKVCKAIFSW